MDYLLDGLGRVISEARTLQQVVKQLQLTKVVSAANDGLCELDKEGKTGILSTKWVGKKGK